MHQGDLAGVAAECNSGTERGVVAAVDHHGLVCKAGQRLRVVEQPRALEMLGVGQRQPAWHKGAHTRCNKNRAGHKGLARCGAQAQQAVVLAGQRGDLFTQVHGGLEGGDLLQQRCHQGTPGGHRRARNVVDGFVAVERNTLAARVGQCVHDVAGDFQQAQLEGLEQADGACADDECVGVNDVSRGLHHRLGCLLFELGDLARLAVPLVGIGQRGFALGDALELG